MSIVDVRMENWRARVAVNHPQVNTASTTVRRGLLDAVANVQGGKRAILKCTGPTFIAGGSIRATLDAFETRSHGSRIRAARHK